MKKLLRVHQTGKADQKGSLTILLFVFSYCCVGDGAVGVASRRTDFGWNKQISTRRVCRKSVCGKREKQTDGLTDKFAIQS
jgi:hypothetical protein